MPTDLRGQEASSPSRAVAEANRTLARSVFEELLNGRRFGLFDCWYAPDFTKHVDGATYTLAEERQQAQGMYDMSRDLRFSIDALIADGDRVAVLYTARGHMTGPLAGLAATGKPLNVVGVTIYRFRGGKVVEEWTVYNMLEILKQAGHYPPRRPNDDASPVTAMASLTASVHQARGHPNMHRKTRVGRGLLGR